MAVARRVARRIRTLGRVGIAVALLALLWFATVTGVEQSTRQVDERRMEDRRLIAQALAGPVEAWLEAGEREADALASQIAAADPQSGVSAYMASQRRFGHSALVVDGGMRVLAATADLSALTGRVAAPCEIVAEETGERTVESGVHELVERARGAEGAVISPITRVPGECQTPFVAAAMAGPGGVAIVLGRPHDAVAHIRAGELSGGDETVRARVFLVDPARIAVEPGGEPRTAPGRVAAFLDRVGAEEVVQRYPVGDGGSVDRIGAYTDLGHGWSLVLEQDAGAFDLQPQEEPSYLVATILVMVFGAVFVLVAWFDIRRRRAHRRAEVAKNAFFSVAGHELRTPLTSLKGFMETLHARWDDVGDEQRKMLIDRMLPQVRRLDRLIERLLVAASIQSETHTHPQVAPTEVEGILERVAERFGPEAPLHTFEVDVEADLPQVQGDPNALEQVVVHLVDNAVKYSPSGGVVRLAAVRGRRAVEIVVEDDGVGLPSDTSRIFEALVQGEEVTKRVHDEGGMGLGLFIVRTLVGEMGGKVRAERREPQGARFVVTMRPAQTRAKTPAAAAN